MGNAKPVTTIVDVRKRPRSTGPEPSYVAENSSPPHCENRAFGSGARTNVRAKNAYFRQWKVDIFKIERTDK